MNAGIHNIPMAAYLADPAPEPSLSSSCAHTLLTRAPVHAWMSHPRLGCQRNADSDAADIGSVAHDVLLGGEAKICVINPMEYPSSNGTFPDGWTNKAIRAARDTARANGLVPILSKQMGGVRNMVSVARAFLAESELAGVLGRGQPELTMLWQEDGAWCRARPDWLTDDHDVMLHYKTTKASANPEAFIRGIMPSMGYDLALAFYARGLTALSDYPTPKHVILVQEQLPPHACSLISMTPAFWAVADSKVERALKLWRECRASGEWSGYSGRIHYAEPRPWDVAMAEEAMAEEGEGK